jgi:hypothetical protein
MFAFKWSLNKTDYIYMFEYLTQIFDQFMNFEYIGIILCVLGAAMIGAWVYYKYIRKEVVVEVKSSEDDKPKQTSPKPTVLLFYLNKCDSLAVIQKLDTSMYNVEYINCDPITDPRIKEYNITHVPAVVYRGVDGVVRKFTNGMITLESIQSFINETAAPQPDVVAEGDGEVAMHDNIKIPDLNLPFGDDPV